MVLSRASAYLIRTLQHRQDTEVIFLENSGGLTWSFNSAARQWSDEARAGCSGPSDFSSISIARRYRASASSFLPYR